LECKCRYVNPCAKAIDATQSLHFIFPLKRPVNEVPVHRNHGGPSSLKAARM